MTSANTEHNGLTVRGVSKRFGATQALHSVDLDVRPGECVALLGENGAGKSTISKIIAGDIQSDTGEMWWNGRPYAPSAPADALDAGIGLIHQEMRLLPDLSIAENVFVGRQLVSGGRIDRKEMDRRAQEQLRQKQSIYEYRMSKASLARAVSRLKEKKRMDINL